MKKKLKNLVMMTLAVALALSLLPAAALAAPEQEDEPQSVGISVTAEKIEVTQPDGTKTVLPAAKSVSLRQGEDWVMRDMLGSVGNLVTAKSGNRRWSPWQIYTDAVAAGLATPSEELDAYFDDPEADAGQLICMVLETLHTEGLATIELTAPTGGKLQSADGSEAGELPANSKVSALGFCVNGRAAVLVDGVLRFLPVEDLRTAEGAPAGEELDWVATKPCGYYDEQAGTTVVVLPSGMDCELNGDLDSLTVEGSVQGDVTLGKTNIGKAYHFGTGNFIVGNGAKVAGVETTDKSKVKEDGGSVGSVKQVEKLRVTLPGGKNTLPDDGSVSINVAANARGVRWSVGNPSVARIEALYETSEIDLTAESIVKVYGISGGGTYITARANGQRASVWMGVQPHAQKMGFFRAPGAKIKVGDTIQLLYGFSPVGSYTGYTVNWETSDPNVAMVAGSRDGLTEGQQMIYDKNLISKPNTTVLGVGAGTATITARTADGRLSASYVVTVEGTATDSPYPYLIGQNGEGIDSLTLLKGERYTLMGSHSIGWLSAQDWSRNKTIASFVDVKHEGGNVCTVYAKEAGYGLIKCSFAIGEETRVGIGVADPLPEELTLCEGESFLLGTFRSTGLGQLRSANEDVAAIKFGPDEEDAYDTKIYLETKKSGTTTVSLWGYEGKNDYTRKLSECRVTVRPAAQGVTLNETSLSLQPGENAKLAAAVLPEDAYSINVTWQSDNPAIATVDKDGNVVAVSPGKAKVTATAEAGGKSAACEVTVSPSVTGVKLDKSTATLVAGGYVKLTATPLPAGAISGVEWTTSDPSVATMDENGGVTAVAPGSAKITAKTARGGFTAECDISVRAAVSSLTLNETNLKMYTGDTFKLQPTVLPAEANQKVTYSGNDERVATVGSDGTITAKGPGRMTVTARTEDIPGKDGVIRGKLAQCFVQVTDYVAVTNIDMKATASVEAKKTITLNAQVMPTSASVKGVTWSSSDKAVATVSNGVVTGVAEGTTVITAKSVDNDSITASCIVKVIPEGGVAVQKVVVTSSGWPGGVGQTNPYPGDSTTLTATVTPGDATYDKITWTVEGGTPGESGVIRITPIGNGSTATLKVLKQGSGSYHIRATAKGVTSEYADSFVISTIEVPPL